MVVEWPNPTMRGQSRVEIKTHGALAVGIWARYGVNLGNNPQISRFLISVKSERFTGFSGNEKEQTEPDRGLF